MAHITLSHPTTNILFHSSEHKIGAGAYGTVSQEHGKPNNVVKVYERTPELQSSVVREISALVLLKDRCSIPRLDAVYIEDSAHRISITKSDSSLTALVSKYKLSEAVVKSLLLELLRTIATMSNFNVSQRDVKPANILCTIVEDEAGRVIDVTDFKLCDFGLARYSDSESSEFLTGNIQTLWYRAPEVIVNDSKYVLDRVDIWSLGIVAIELLTGSPCVPASTNLEQLTNISKIFGAPDTNGTEFEGMIPKHDRASLALMIPNISLELVEILEAMTAVYPKDRPSAFDLLSRPYFSSIRFPLKPTEKLRQVSRLYPIDSNKVINYKQRQDVITEIIDLYENEVFTNPETLVFAIQLMDLTLTRANTRFMDLVHSPKMLAIACVALSCKVHEHNIVTTDVLTDHLELDYDATIKLEREIFKLMGCMLFIPTIYSYSRLSGCNMKIKEFVTRMTSPDYIKNDYTKFTT